MFFSNCMYKSTFLSHQPTPNNQAQNKQIKGPNLKKSWKHRILCITVANPITQSLLTSWHLQSQPTANQESLPLLLGWSHPGFRATFSEDPECVLGCQCGLSQLPGVGTGAQGPLPPPPGELPGCYWPPLALLGDFKRGKSGEGWDLGQCHPDGNIMHSLLCIDTTFQRAFRGERTPWAECHRSQYGGGQSLRPSTPGKPVVTRDSTPTLTPTCPLDRTSEHLGTFPGDFSIGTQQNQTRSLSPPGSGAQTEPNNWGSSRSPARRCPPDFVLTKLDTEEES